MGLGHGRNDEYVNEVRLVGRISGVPDERELPSGDEVTLLRVVVRRPERPHRTSRAQVDTLDVACWTAGTRRRAASLGVGDLVEVRGALRRRFFRVGSGAASRYEVEATSVKRMSPRRGSAQAEARGLVRLVHTAPMAAAR